MGYTPKQQLILGLCGSIFVISTVAVAARFFVRTVLRPKSLGWDDWTMLSTYGVAIVTSTFEYMMVENGVGQHMKYVNPQNLPQLAKLTLLNSILNLFGTMMVKVSICIFLLRLVHLANRTVKWMVMINLAVLVPVTVAVIIVDLLQCIPLNGYWDRSIEARCINPNTVNILLKIASSVGVVTDFFTAGTFIALICRLNMSPDRKRVMYILLGLGFLTAATSIAKTVSIKWTPVDYTWDNADVGYWAALEHQGGITIACIPTLRPLFEYLRGRNYRPSHGGGSSNSNHELGFVARRSAKTGSKRESSENILPREEVEVMIQIKRTTELTVSHQSTKDMALAGSGDNSDYLGRT